MAQNKNRAADLALSITQEAEKRLVETKSDEVKANIPPEIATLMAMGETKVDGMVMECLKAVDRAANKAERSASAYFGPWNTRAELEKQPEYWAIEYLERKLRADGFTAKTSIEGITVTQPGVTPSSVKIKVEMAW